jgi:hypothetical protein
MRRPRPVRLRVIPLEGTPLLVSMLRTESEGRTASIQRIHMSTHSETRRDVGATSARDVNGRRPRRLSTETKAAFKTTEFFAYVGVLVAILIAAAVIDESDAGGFGARQAWLYATILTVGYMVSRGLAKSGSRDPYDADDH